MNENEINNIRRLLDKYYLGQTSESEENTLRKVLRDENIDPSLEVDREMFRHLSSAADVLTPVGLEARLSKAIDSRADSEMKAESNYKKLRLLGWRSIASVAASIAMLISLGIFFERNHATSPELLTGSGLTPEETYAQTEKALMIFADALNKGVDGVATVAKTSEKVKMQVDSTFHIIEQVQIMERI
ncbi:MAG: hypothetical protein NC221_02460 [Duncaniella sp.]|nr:hypothetical protein [Muribaculum sp.]MCM1254963.1 hypothetical protein [Duncaniella sp.]